MARSFQSYGYLKHAIIPVLLFFIYPDITAGRVIVPPVSIDTAGYGKKIDRLKTKAVELVYEDLQLAMATIDSSLSLLESYPDQKRLATSFAAKGIILTRTGQPLPAKVLLFKSLELVKGKGWTKLEGRIYNIIGNNYLALGEFEMALSYHLRTLNLATILDDKELLEMSNNNVALVYYKLEDFTNAIKFFRKALVHGEFQATTLGNIGLCWKFRLK